MNVYDIVDIANIPRNSKQYNGAEDKFGITMCGEDYIVKRQRGNWNNVYSEYIASNIIRVLGGYVHETYLGKLNDEVVVLCKDFTSKDYRLKSFNSAESMYLDTEMDRHEYYYDEVKYLLSKLKNCDYDVLINQFNEMFIFDALLGNPDRHKGNWGVLKHRRGYTAAPIFDNGACLFPRAVSENIDADWVKERIYTFPNSKIMFNNKRERSVYYDVIKSTPELKQVCEIITHDKIQLVLTFIQCAPISDYLKTLYSTMVWYRFKCILKGEEFVWEGLK